MICKILFAWTAPVVLWAQNPQEMKSILDRLDRLEAENRALRQDLRELRAQMVQPPASAEERLEIQENRIQEHAQTKVEASQKFPIRVTGMALFNLFHNGRHANGLDIPPTASLNAGRHVGGATFRQSILGLEYHGPNSVLGARVRGSITADFYDGPTEPQYPPFRVRTAAIELDWANRSLLVGLQKAIFNPREPNSLMQVGISPLTAAGNLWRWQPQVRFEQRFTLSEMTVFRGQLGILQTSEEFGIPAGAAPNLERRRPGLEGRFEFTHRLGDETRLEIAPGFHASTTHAAGSSVPSNVFSLDWFANPWRPVQFSGVFFAGKNIGHFGGLRQGFRVLPDGSLLAVRSRGGWAQLTLLAGSRLSFNIYAGQQDDRNADLAAGAIGKNLSGAANLMFRVAPNVIISLESMQTRTTYLGPGARKLNRYDLAVAYLF